MKDCLQDICKEFEDLQGFLTQKTQEKIDTTNRLFFRFVNCFHLLGEEKERYPKEFSIDSALFIDGDSNILKKFQDVEMRYLMLSDFYDYARLTKEYKKY